MATPGEMRGRARATWAAGDWDSFSRLIAGVGELVIERANIEPGVDLLDVGTGTGRNVAIPVARAGADVVGLDVTPELLELARGHAAEAGVDVERFGELVARFNASDGGRAQVESEYFLITVDR